MYWKELQVSVLGLPTQNPIHPQYNLRLEWQNTLASWEVIPVETWVDVGIGAGIGVLLAGGIIAFRQLNIWPFNRKPKTSPFSEQEDEQKDGGIERRRLHARAWIVGQ